MKRVSVQGRPRSTSIGRLALISLLSCAPVVADAQLRPDSSGGGGGNSRSSGDPFADYFNLSQAQQIQQQAAAAQVSTGSAPAASSGAQPVVITGESDTSNGAVYPPQPVVDNARRQVPARAPDEFETYASQVAGKNLRRFGTSLLIPEARGFSAPPTANVPDDYRLNPGDVLSIGMTGSVQAAGLTVTIDPQGRAFVPRIGAINLAGVRYADARDVIARQVARFYRNVDITVSVTRLHGITVYVTGFAALPGSYTVSSLSTLVNAVLAAGGPSPGGSFRSIQVRRNGQLISDFDLYDLLLRGNKSGDVVLQNGDVIYIAPVAAQVAVIGSVNNEAIFEASPKDSLRDVLLYAGGANTIADESRLLLLDPVSAPGTGWKEVTAREISTIQATRGQVVRVLSGVGIAHPLEQQPVLVTVSGEVANPGRYYFSPGVTMGQVIAKAGGLSSGAYPYAAVFSRDRVRDQQRLSYARAIQDMKAALTARPLVSSTANKTIAPAEQLQIIKALIDQLEARQPDGRVVLDIGPNDRMLPTDIVMENNDVVYVPPRPTVVGVFGSVANPATFSYESGERLESFVDKTGGPLRTADKSEIFVIRANGSVVAKRRGALKLMALPGDLVYVPLNVRRGETFEKISAIFQLLSATALPVATVYSLVK